METKSSELLVKVGPLEGRRFTVTEAGIRLGRSSSCEISIPDPALSRNQCLFELRDGKTQTLVLRVAEMLRTGKWGRRI